MSVSVRTRHGKERAENHLERRQLVVSKLLKLIKLLQERVDESQWKSPAQDLSMGPMIR